MGKVVALIPAAGQGKRMGASVNKQLLNLADKPILAHTLEIFQSSSLIDEIVLVAAQDEISLIKEQVVKPFNFSKVSKIVSGGKERQDSVRAGLAVLSDLTEWVVVHDGARPLLLLAKLENLIRIAWDLEAVIAAVKVKDTIKQADCESQVVATVPRENLWAVQTPQIFRKDVLTRAHAAALETGFVGTDDASLVERLGVKVCVAEGSYDNIKITTPEDMTMAESILRRRGNGERNSLRIGFGYDVHRLVPSRDLILGGVKIDYATGLLGHSDADVLIHAIMDAILGAAAMGDIGRHFPDSEEKYKGISSLKLLGHVAAILQGAGFRVGNIDATIVAEKPKLAPYIPAMVKNISEMLNIGIDKVNIKATTTEGLGFTGIGEGMAAHAVAALHPKT